MKFRVVDSAEKSAPLLCTWALKVFEVGLGVGVVGWIGLGFRD